MRSMFFFLIALLLMQPVFSQQPTQKEIQAQMQQAKLRIEQRITDLEKRIADAKMANENPETIKKLEDQLAMIKKMTGVVDKASSLSGKRPTALEGTPVTVPPYQSPFFRLTKQPVIAPTVAQAKDRLLWYKGRKSNDSTLVTTQGRVVRYSRKRNMVIVQPNEKKDSSIMKIVMNLGRSRQWTNKIISDEAARKNSFFDYPLMEMTVKEFDYIEKEFDKIADNTIKLPGTGTNLMTAINQLPVTGIGGGPYLDVETIVADDWIHQTHQEILNLINNPPPLDFPPPPKHEFDLCYYCDTSLQGKYYRDKDAWCDKFTEYEAGLMSKCLGINRQFAIMGIEDISNSDEPNLEQDLDRAMQFVLKRLDQKIDLAQQRYKDDPFRVEAILTITLSWERQKALMGFTVDEAYHLTGEFFGLESIDRYIKEQIDANNYNVIFNSFFILGIARQKALMGFGADPDDDPNDLIVKIDRLNRFAITMDLEFQLVWKDNDDKDIMRATGYLTTPEKTYVSLGVNKCKWQLYLFNPNYLNDYSNEQVFEVPLKIQEGVKLIKEDDHWVSYPYTGPTDMKTVFPSIRIDFCNNNMQDSALMDVIRYSDADLNSVSSPDEFAKKYTIDLQGYVNMMFGSIEKTKANLDAVIDISDEIMDMQSGTSATPTGYTLLDKMQIDYKMMMRQLKMKEKIANAVKENASVILFDAVNQSPTLIDKEVNMAGSRGEKIEMRKALVKLKVVQEVLPEPH